MPSNPFVIREIGPPGSQTAVADFTCPKCEGETRFTTSHERGDGGFVCPHCGLKVNIQGPRLSDYQEQLDQIDANLDDFSQRVEEKVRRAARDLAGGSDDSTVH